MEVKLPYKTFHQYFEAQVEATPNHVAVRYSRQSLTYEELNQKANQIAYKLKNLRVEPNTLVGLFMYRSHETLIQILAILKAGGGYLPLDPSYPKSRIAFILKDANISLVLTEKSLADDLERLKKNFNIHRFNSDEYVVDRTHAHNPECQNSPDDLAYVIYTSGSTGYPKGVMVPHRGLSNYLNWCRQYYPLREGKGSLVHSSISFDATITGLFAPLLVGKTVELIPENNEIETLAEALRTNEPYSLIKITPSHLRVLNELLPDSELKKSTYAFVIGGEALQGESLERWRRYAPEVRIFNEYGPTETVVGCCVYEVTAQTDLKQPIPIGKPIDNTQIHILDDNLNPLQVEASGQIYIGGAGVALGYLNRPELTQERFIQTKFSTDRLYRSGDLGRRLEDGNIEYLGRVDDQIKIRGYRIEPGEIENTLIHHAAVKESAVLSIKNEQGHSQLLAYLTLKQDKSNELTKSLRAYCSEHLPDYMIPAEFIVIDQIPLTSNGKIDKAVLLEKIKQRDKVPSPQESAPMSEEESILTDIWSAFLNQSEIGLNDNFFELGGDSILGIQIVAQAKKFGFKLMPRDIVKHQTIAELAQAAVAKQGEKETSKKMSPEKMTGLVPLLPIQHWFFEKHGSHPHHYNFASLFQTPSELQAGILEKVVRVFIAHHDSFRLRFKQNPNTKKWEQTLIQASRVSKVLEVIDLSHHHKASQKIEIERLSSQTQAELNIETGPLVKFLFFKCGEAEAGRLLIVVHHLVMDGVSWRVLFEDLQVAYQQLTTGKAIEFEKSSSLQNWAEFLSTHYKANEAAYWLEQLQLKPMRFPLDYSRAEEALAEVNCGENSESIQIDLSESQTEQLLQVVPKKYSTQVNEVLLTALNLSFSKWLGKGNLWIDMDAHGREDLSADINLSRTIGWFTALFPFVLDLDSKKALNDVIKSTKEQVRAIPNNGLGYGVLYYLKKHEGIRRTAPHPPISFNYLGQFKTTDQNAAFSSAEENCGDKKSPLMKRNNLIDIVGLVQNNRLRVSWTFCDKLHKPATIEALAAQYKTSLLEIIEHCVVSQEKEHTPSDFSLLDVDQEELNFLMEQINGT